MMHPTMNIHYPRTLDESYYGGLYETQLAKRNNDQVVSRMAKQNKQREKLVMITQLWLWKMDNIVITGFPDTNFDTIALSRLITCIHDQMEEMTSKTREALNSEHIAAWILSERIQPVDRPYTAGLSEPVFYTFEKAVAGIFDEVQTYIDKEGMDKISITREMSFVHTISDVRDELTMI